MAHHIVYVLLESVVISSTLTALWVLWGVWMLNRSFERQWKLDIQHYIDDERRRFGWLPAKASTTGEEEPQCSYRWPETGERCVTAKADHHPGLEHAYQPAGRD